MKKTKQKDRKQRNQKKQNKKKNVINRLEEREKLAHKGNIFFINHRNEKKKRDRN